MSRLFVAAVIACAALLPAGQVSAATVTVDPGASWLGFMNVSELPSNGGGYVFGSGWGTADLTATFSGDVLTLGPNTIGDPNPFWYQGGGGPGAPGNKTMEANMYIQDDSLSGQVLTFEGVVLSNSLTSAHSAIAFIKDFAPDYSSSISTTVALSPGSFSLTQVTLPLPGRHVQYGFQMTGPNVWITDVGPFGTVRVTAIPEPMSLALAGAGLFGIAAIRSRRRAF